MNEMEGDSIKKKISAVIFTKDNQEKVSHLVKEIRNYVDEIVIIDSSNQDNLKILKQKNGKYAKIYHFPPLGYADPFHLLGSQLANNEWILHLDDDEVPTKKLLENLQPDEKCSAILLPREEAFREFSSLKPRLYNKNKMAFSGVVHWSLIPLGETKKSKIGLIHYEKPTRKKWSVYALLDSYTWGFKILWVLDNTKWHPHDKELEPPVRLFKNLITRQFSFAGKKIGWFLASMEYLGTSTYYALKRGSIKARLMKLFRNIQIGAQILNSFDTKITIWEKMFAAGSLNKYLGLNNLEDFNRLKNYDCEGLALLIKLIEEKAAE
jgi:hypothetical protein